MFMFTFILAFDCTMSLFNCHVTGAIYWTSDQGEAKSKESDEGWKKWWEQEKKRERREKAFSLASGEMRQETKQASCPLCPASCSFLLILQMSGVNVSPPPPTPVMLLLLSPSCHLKDQFDAVRLLLRNTEWFAREGAGNFLLYPST